MAGWFWFGGLKNSSFGFGEDENVGLSKIAEATSREDFISNVAILDTDGDGLKDWEESLWGSDVGKQDSDDDGYTDKEEVDGGYDPTDASSNPETGEKKKEQKKTDSLENFLTSDNSGSGEGNLTEALATSMSQQIAKNPDAQPESLDPFAQMSPETIIALKEYVGSFSVEISESELKVSDDNSKEAVEAYIIECFRKLPPLPFPNKHDYEIFSEAMESGNFGAIDKNISYYQGAVFVLKKISVPSDLLQAHKRQIELLMATEKVFEAVKNVRVDALKTILALEQYKNIEKEMKNLTEEFSRLFLAHNVN